MLSDQVSISVFWETHLLYFLIECNRLLKSKNGKIMVISKGVVCYWGVELWVNFYIRNFDMVIVFWSIQFLGSQRHSEAFWFG